MNSSNPTPERSDDVETGVVVALVQMTGETAKDRNVAKAYGVVTATRKYAFRWTFYIGGDGKILHIDRKVRSGSAGADVAARLKELGVKAK